MIDMCLPCYIFRQDLWDLAKNAVNGFLELENKGRLIIVDNGSTMAGGWLRSVADVYVRIENNLGYAPAMNMALKLATTNLVALAETDIRVPKDALKIAEKEFNDNMGSLHFRMVGYDTPMVTGDDLWIEGKERWCTISFAVFRREAVGLFDENFIKANYEDYDILHRLRQKYKTAYTNKVCYQHNDSYTQRQLDQTDRQKWADNNLKYFVKKWGEEPDKLFQSLYPEQWEKSWRPFP